MRVFLMAPPVSEEVISNSPQAPYMGGDTPSPWARKSDTGGKVVHKEPWLNQEEEEEWIGTAEEFEDALAAPESVENDPYFFVRTYATDQGSIWHAARIGDAQRIQHLLSLEGTDVNQRDRWDSTPLYYACLAGQTAVARCLLENGASCSEYTFDGERCYYVALTKDIRQLLLAFAQRPVPLPPLQASLKDLCTLCEDTEAKVQKEVVAGQWSDFTFELGTQFIPVHQAILAARSRFLRKRLRSGWLGRKDEERGRLLALHHPLYLKNPNALQSLIVWMYTDRLEASSGDVEAVKRLARRCRLPGLVQAIEKEQRTLKYYFKTTRREVQPRRFVLQPRILPRGEQLAADLSALMHLSEQLASEKGKMQRSTDFADACLRVEGRIFRCHRCILAARSDFFAALFNSAERFGKESATAAKCENSTFDSLPVFDVGAVSPKAMNLVLRFIYTNNPTEAGRLPGWLMRQIPEGVEEIFDAADRLLVFSLKRELAEALLKKFEERPQLQGGLDGVCRLLLTAEMYNVPLLRDHCLHRLAARFSDLASRTAPQHEQLLFAQFLQAIAPAGPDLLDGSRVLGASKGSIVGGGVSGAGVGTILQDLREAFLQDYGGADSEGQRDKSAKEFDQRLHILAARSLQYDGDR